MDACLVESSYLTQKKMSKETYDMAHGMLIKELTQPKLTLTDHSRAPATTRSLTSLSPVVKLKTAP